MAVMHVNFHIMDANNRILTESVFIVRFNIRIMETGLQKGRPDGDAQSDDDKRQVGSRLL